MKKVLFGGNEVELFTHSPLVGEKAPNFVAVNDKFELKNLHDFKDSNILISAFPSIDTPICALQTKRFNKEIDNIKDLQTISISVDLPFALKRFCAAEGIKNMTVLSDANYLDFTTRYGLLIKHVRLSARAVIILDKNHIIKYFEIVDDVAKEPNYEAILEVLKKL